jgi:hypothetical protein
VSDPRRAEYRSVTGDEKLVLASVLADHEPSLSSYGDVTCLCGEEFRAGDTASDSGYRTWSHHVIETYEWAANAVWSLRHVDAGYR